MLTGPQNPDVSDNTVLALTGQGSAGVARGVGVQLVYNNTPLTLGNNLVLKRTTGGGDVPINSTLLSDQYNGNHRHRKRVRNAEPYLSIRAVK